MKICNHCNIEKELSEFHFDKKAKDGLRSTCKLCRNQEQSHLRMIKYNNDLIYRKKVNDYNKIQQNKRNKNNPLYSINIRLKSLYGIDLNQYNKLLRNQNGLCAICHQTEIQKDIKGKIKRLHVDHCHITGKVRGLLCSECNTGLGKFRENITYLTTAINYLKEAKV